MTNLARGSRRIAGGPFPSLGLVAAIAVGVVLRLIWPGDIEYKFDEWYSYERVCHVGQTEPFPWFGMPTSVGTANPGLSVWAFLGLGQVFPIHEPPDLARAVSIVNILAIVLLVVFAMRCVPRAEREPWLWAAALVAVNPLAILFQRKIWPPSLFPILTLAMLWGWWRRERRGGAFTWGLVGALLGQIQASGYFFAAGFALWAALFDRKRVAWRNWFFGSFVGTIPLMPWLWYMATQAQPIAGKGPQIAHVFEGKFWTRWLTEPFGFGLDFTLEGLFGDFLRSPYVAGRPTFLGLLLHLALAVMAAIVLVHAGIRIARCGWRNVDWFGRNSGSAFTVAAAALGFGLLMTLSALPLHRYYMIVLFPLEFVWLARLVLARPRREDDMHPSLSTQYFMTPGAGCPGERQSEIEGVEARNLARGRRLLASLCVVQAALSMAFLHYVHVRGGMPGEYGLTYRAQNRRADDHSEPRPQPIAYGATVTEIAE